MANKANLGRGFEELILFACQQYKAQRLAMIEKIHTPWTVIRAGKEIVSAYPKEKSTVDFAGVIAGGRAIAFEAKSTENKTSFPFKNIGQEQFEYLDDFHYSGGIAFFLIEFSRHEVVYLVPVQKLKKYWNLYITKIGKSSIDIGTLGEIGCEVPQGNGIVLDFLKAWKEFEICHDRD
jgi:recombination protein U